MHDTEQIKGKNITLIVNPKAGKLVSEQRAERISSLLQKQECNVTCFYTEYAKHAIQIVKDNAHRSDVFVCCGGDGTLNEVVGAVTVYASGKPVGYIPAGTTNDFASTVGLSKNVDKSVKAITDGNISALDLGYIRQSGTYFTYVASFGAFTNVSYETTQESKNVFGHAAYILDGIRSLKDIKPYHMVLKTESEVIDGDFIFGSITNSMSLGGIMKFKKEDVSLNDGKFEVFLIKMPEQVQQFNEIMKNLIIQKHDEKYVRLLHASHIEMRFDSPTAFTADGEFAGEYTELTVDNINKGLKIYTQKDVV